MTIVLYQRRKCSCAGWKPPASVMQTHVAQEDMAQQNNAHSFSDFWNEVHRWSLNWHSRCKCIKWRTTKLWWTDKLCVYVCAIFYDFSSRRVGLVYCHLSDTAKLVWRLHGSLSSKAVPISLLGQQNFLASAAYQ